MPPKLAGSRPKWWIAVWESMAKAILQTMRLNVIQDSIRGADAPRIMHSATIWCVPRSKGEPKATIGTPYLFHKQ